MSLREGYVRSAGHYVWFGVAGRATVPEKAPLLCLHAGPGLPHDYLEPLSALTTAGREVIFYDQLGCGNSDQPNDAALCTIDYFVSEIDAVRRSLRLDRLHMLGHSWGGMLGMEYLLQQPAGVVSFIASNTSSSMPGLIVEIARLPQSLPAEVRNSGGAEEVMAFARTYQCRAAPWPECLNRALEKYLQNRFVNETMLGPSVFEITGAMRDWNITDRLPEIGVPMLVICGRHDETTPALATQIADGVARAELRVFRDSSHMPHLEEPDGYIRAVDDFLTRVERAN